MPFKKKKIIILLNCIPVINDGCRGKRGSAISLVTHIATCNVASRESAGCFRNTSEGTSQKEIEHNDVNLSAIHLSVVPWDRKSRG